MRCYRREVGRIETAITFGAATLMTAVAGCSSTSSNPGAPDGAAMTPEAQSDAPHEDSGPNACIDDASVKLIQASDYDQSCTVDTDCRGIAEGNACVPCAFACGLGAAINVSALAQYNSDVANTPAVAIKFNMLICASACEEAFGPCCVGGKCQTSTTSQCPGAATDAGDAAADTGADAAVVDAATDSAMDAGPADADACAPSGGCAAACVDGRHNVSIMVDGCLVTECCVLDDAGTD